MYEDFYNLNGRPFQLMPDPRYYYDSHSHGKAMSYLQDGLEQANGNVLITGGIGTGKTTLALKFGEIINKDKYAVGMIANTQLKADELLVVLASAFGISTNMDNVNRLQESIEKFCLDQVKENRRTILILDEVQNLSNTVLLELQKILRLNGAADTYIQCFLFGQHATMDRINAESELAPFKEDISATYHLDTIATDEIDAYLKHRLRHVGWDNDPTFSEDALKAFYDHTKGVPRQLNTLCARVLLYTALEEYHKIDKDAVDSIAADMASEIHVSDAQKMRLSSHVTHKDKARSVHDKTIPLEDIAPLDKTQGGKKEPSKSATLKDRMDKLEGMAKSRNKAVQQLAALVTQIANKK